MIALTRIPCGANSLAKNCVTLFTPAFDAEYVNTLDNGVVDDTDEMLIILPVLSCSTIRLANTCVVNTSPFRLTSIISSHSFSSRSKNGVGLFFPEAFNRMSQPPDHCSISAARFSIDSRELTSPWNDFAIPPFASISFVTSSAVSIFRPTIATRSEEHTSALQSRGHLVCRLLREQKKCKCEIR